MRHRWGAAAFAAWIGVSGCAAATSAAPTCPPMSAPTTAHLNATKGAVSVSTDSASVAPGGTVTFTVVATGPVDYVSDCAQPLQVSIVDSVGMAVAAASAVTPGASRCGAVSLPAGRQASYSTSWTPAATLPSGIYTATLILGDQTPVNIAIPVRTVAGGCG